MNSRPINQALQDQLKAAIAGTKLEAKALEEQARQNAVDVAAAQRRQKRRAYRSARAAARRESVENWKGKETTAAGVGVPAEVASQTGAESQSVC